MKTFFLPALLSLVCLVSFARAQPEADRAIEKALGASFVFETFFDNMLTLSVAEGVVTLAGVVREPGEKALAEDAAARVAGVARVENKLAVRAAGAPGSDALIEFQINRRLLIRKGVSGRNTRADVRRGVVELSGTAGNDEQKTLTEELVREIAGVKSVANNLVVNNPPGNTPGYGERFDDASIAAVVKFALRQWPALAEAPIQVVSEGGVVKLGGAVAHVDSLADAEKLAMSIRGVRTVKSELKVRE